MRFLLGILLAATMCISGCASIPLSTMMSMSRMSPRSLAQVDPAQLRVRLSVPQGFDVDVAATRLNFSIKNPSVDQSSEMGVNALSVTKGTRSGGFLSPDLPIKTYLFALTPEGKAELRSLQQTLQQVEHGTFNAGFKTHFAKRPPGTKKVTFWVDLKLSASEPFMPLLDGAEVEFKDS